MPCGLCLTCEAQNTSHYAFALENIGFSNFGFEDIDLLILVLKILVLVTSVFLPCDTNDSYKWLVFFSVQIKVQKSWQVGVNFGFSLQ